MAQDIYLGLSWACAFSLPSFCICFAFAFRIGGSLSYRSKHKNKSIGVGTRADWHRTMPRCVSDYKQGPRSLRRPRVENSISSKPGKSLALMPLTGSRKDFCWFRTPYTIVIHISLALLGPEFSGPSFTRFPLIPQQSEWQ